MFLASLPLLAMASEAPGQSGRNVEIVLHNRSGMEVHIIPFGATITRVIVPDRDGHRANVVLGYATPAEYRLKNRKNMFGATIGRFAGRIAEARFMLGGKRVQLVPNDGPNALHGGGKIGLDNLDWTTLRTGAGSIARLRITTPDGFQGFPGRLTVTATYRLTPDDALVIAYQARSSRDTVLNLTNHSYFNLAGEGSGSVAGQRLQIAATRYVATDAGGIPSGAFPAVSGTPLDFRCSRSIGEQLDSKQPPLNGRGYNHAWLLDKAANRLAGAARLDDPQSGRTLTILTSEPSVQVYTGGYIDGQDAGPSGRTIRPGDGVAIETEHVSDSPNQPRLPSSFLRAGKLFQSTTIWRFGVSGRERDAPCAIVKPGSGRRIRQPSGR